MAVQGPPLILPVFSDYWQKCYNFPKESVKWHSSRLQKLVMLKQLYFMGKEKKKRLLPDFKTLLQTMQVSKMVCKYWELCCIICDVLNFMYLIFWGELLTVLTPAMYFA